MNTITSYYHDDVAWLIHQRSFSSTDGSLTFFLLLCLFPLSCFLLRHFLCQTFTSVSHLKIRILCWFIMTFHYICNKKSTSVITCTIPLHTVSYIVDLQSTLHIVCPHRTCTDTSPPSKIEKLSIAKCWISVGPALSTVVQPWSSIGLILLSYSCRYTAEVNKPSTP